MIEHRPPHADEMSIVLPGGVIAPRVAFGSFQVSDVDAQAMAIAALELGYRHVDTAAVYGNEAGIGRAFRSSGIRREELFVTTKLWNDDQGYERTLRAYDASLARLGLDYVDLFLVHWPSPKRGLFAESWRALNVLLEQRRVRAIGVSNFLPEHLQVLASTGLSMPSVNQIEVHPLLQQRAAQQANAQYGAVTQSWSPLSHGIIMRNAEVRRIAREHGRTPAQVVLRWHLQQGRMVVPKSVDKARLAENLQVGDLLLSDSELAAIDDLEQGARLGPDPRALG